MKRYLALVLALLMLLSCTACGGDENQGGGPTNNNPVSNESNGNGSTTEEEHVSKTLTVGTTNDVTIPFDNVNSTNINGFGLCYDRLTYLDPYTGERVSNVLNDWYYEDDLHLVLKVKEGVTFTDGTPMTGEDLVYTFSDEVARGSNNAANLGNFDWEGATVSDDGLTVTIPTFEEYAPGITSLSSSWIENKAYDEAHPTDDVAWWDTVQGTGPYYCVEQVDGAYSTYALRDNYWGDEEYEFDTVVIKFYSDLNALFIDYENGVIDVALNIGSYNYETALSGGVDNTTVKLVGDGNPVDFCIDYTKVEAWNNPLVRQAVAHAINLDDIGIAGFEGMYKINGSLLPETAAYYENVGVYEYDPDLARELLAEAGYENGFSFTLVTYEKYADLSEALQAQLAAVGITLTLDVGQMLPQLKRILAGEAESSLMNANTDNSSEPSLAYNKLVANSQTPTASIYDEEWNALIDSSYTMDAAKREQIIKDIQQSFYDNVWQIPLVEKCEAWCYRSDVLPENFEAYVGGTSVFRVEK